MTAIQEGDCVNMLLRLDFASKKLVISRQINVFDGLFTSDELTKFRSVLLLVDPYHYDFDTQPTEDHDNILRVGLYKVKIIANLSVWRRNPQLPVNCVRFDDKHAW